MNEDLEDHGFAPTDAALPPESPMGGAMVDPLAADQSMVDPLAGDQPVVDRRKKAVLSVPIEVVVAVGRARPMLSDLVKLSRDSLLTLNSKIEDPVEILIGEKVIARGELQELDDDSGRLGVRLTEVADLTNSL